MTPSGRDLTAATATDLAGEWVGDDSAPGWENQTVPAFLGAFAGWLRDAEGYYANRGQALPEDAWQIVQDALRAAVIYE